MIVGFTSTRNGMTGIQRQILLEEMTSLAITPRTFAIEFHYGDCVGGDAQAFDIADKFGWITVCHPPSNLILRAFTKPVRMLPPAPYLVRNRDIVDVCEGLLAAPEQSWNMARSGTWSTIRHAAKKGKQTTIIFPDGTIRRQ